MNNMGALWIAKDDDGNPKNDKQGNHYMSGQLEIDGKKMRVMLFKNNKTKDTQPDYQMVESQGKGSEKAGSDDEEFGDDIPF